MSRTARLIIGGIVAVLLLILIALVYIWVSGGSAAPSAPLVEATLAATEETSSTTTTFSIVTGESEVRFILDELLRGQLNTVTGRTDQIAGQIAADFATPSNSRVGEIRISARSLRTDSELRDRAIRSQILLSAQDEFEFISFVPTAMEGLPAAVTIGEAFDFEITGDLTIRDITQPVTFAVTVTPVSGTRLEGTATAAVQRGDYGLEIPSVPSVADVDEAVRLEIDFVAEAE